jgi:hypothetical protein
MNAKAIVASGVVMVGMMVAAEARAQEAPGPVPSTGATPIAAKVEDDSPDHERFIRHFAVGYLGISQIPIGNLAAGGATLGVTQGTITAPIIGGRYWLQRNLGIDAGIGIGYASSSATVVAGNTTTTTNNPSQFGFALHGGVPIAFAEGHHYTFELVPEATIGFGTGSISGNPSISESGFRIDVGARIGAEIHFGFIGIPELALQASVGLYVRHQSWGVSGGGNSASGEVTTFATSVQNDPWAIFADTVSALYYF